ncbi:MAG: ATP-binding protein [Desulfuromonadales bacterium]
MDADEGQLSKVFHNIIINATQAMPTGGELTVTAENEQLSDNNPFLLPAGPYIRLQFADQGCGITEEDLLRIFDPYFTTKSSCNGLGLASAYSIITRHGSYGFSGAVAKPYKMAALGQMLSKLLGGTEPVPLQDNVR